MRHYISQFHGQIQGIHGYHLNLLLSLSEILNVLHLYRVLSLSQRTLYELRPLVSVIAVLRLILDSREYGIDNLL